MLPHMLANLILGQASLWGSILLSSESKMEPVEGFEPPASCLQNNRSTTELHRHNTLLLCHCLPLCQLSCVARKLEGSYVGLTLPLSTA